MRATALLGLSALHTVVQCLRGKEKPPVDNLKQNDSEKSGLEGDEGLPTHRGLGPLHWELA